eukprot:TCONS_00049548-protein
MKKQLYRLKQQADQRVGRAEKTDLLTEDLQHVDKTVEKIKHACQTTSKKLQACMQNKEGESERSRKKKLNQLLLGQGMVESSAVLGEGSIFGNVLMTSGEAQTTIASELAICESEIDESVLAPVNKLLEIDLPSIANNKKKLNKARLDMDSCKTRWNNAVKESQRASSNNKQDAVTKANALQSEYEDNTLLFHQLQDALATEMFTFVAGERSYAENVMKLLEAQRRYHKAAYEALEKCLPAVRETINDSMFRPVFGCPLHDHLHVLKREIAMVLEECVLFILDHAMDAEGLFRLAGSASKIKKLKAAFDAGVACVEEYSYEIHVVTGVLKLYLRELPDPILVKSLYDEWIAASKIKDRDQRLQSLWTLVEKLPSENKVNLKYLICFLAKLAENSEVNKMTPSNIAIVVGPNMLWNDNDGGVSIADTGNISIIVESLIEHSNWFFPEGCEFKRHQLSDEQIDAISNRFTQREGEQSPEPLQHSISGGLFSEVSKKLGWNKDGADITQANTTSNTNTAGSQATSSAAIGYYNPLAAQYDPDLDALYDSPPVPPKPPSSNTGGGDDSMEFSRTMSTSSVGSNSEESNLSTPATPTHRRTPSGNLPKRPAPPPPKGRPQTPGSPKTSSSPSLYPKLPSPPDHPAPPPPKPKLSALAKTTNIVDTLEKTE